MMRADQIVEQLRELAAFHRDDRRYSDGNLCDLAADLIEQANRTIRASVVVGNKQRRVNAEDWHALVKGGT